MCLLATLYGELDLHHLVRVVTSGILKKLIEVHSEEKGGYGCTFYRKDIVILEIFEPFR